MTLDKLLKDVQTVAVICNQWGDTGKGKLADWLSYWADVYARGTGGPNAGHTVVIDGKEMVYHQIPTGILNDSKGKPTILGNGMVIDLEGLSEELNGLERERMSYNNLMISKDAHVIMPFHITRDKAKHESQKKGGVGSTGRGIGPAYTDKTARRGIMVEDLFDRDILLKKINKIKEFYPEQKINTTDIIEYLKPYVERIKPFVRDTVTEMHKFMREGKKILLEGAQGSLLSIEHGTYPYLTGSDGTLNGTAGGVGLSANDIDVVWGVVKFPFMTRVGAGPFPTELGGENSEQYCAEGLKHDIFFEAKEYIGMNLNLDKIRKLQTVKDLEALKEEKLKVYDYIKSNRQKVLELCNSQDPLTQGVGIRLAAMEYGATTGRPRRIGWTDAVAAKYAVGINGIKNSLIFLTKADCIAGSEEFKLCYKYTAGSESHTDFSRNEKFLRGVNPGYKSYQGYSDIRHVRNYQSLPKSLKEAIQDFEKFTFGRVAAVSVGPDREETIVR